MRFFLDENVDARARGVLQEMGYDAWTVSDANLASEEDPNLTIYAHEHEAVLLTHDREFSNRFKKHIVGQHIYLDCSELAVRDVLMRRLPDLIELLARYDDLYAEVRPDSVSFTFLSEGW